MSFVNPRVLIFIVAYEAESTLVSVLERIPSSIGNLEVEILIIDDSSNDRTFEVGLLAAHSIRRRITVLYNPTNQGYGGNQKLGYEYALRHGFDFVVLLHGDGQYAPECIPALLSPLIDNSADAILGSRMMVTDSARRGGMPLYKRIGNRILTAFQNRLLGTNLSEFHSGFRAYRVTALQILPYQFNSNRFHFDTEIIIQLLLAGFRIGEVPVPTHYGNEICRVSGLRYAKDVVLTTIRSRMQRLNIFYDRRYDVNVPSNRRSVLKIGYVSSHTAALDAVSAGSTVLDLGCGPGELARELVRKGCVIDRAEHFAPVDGSRLPEFTAAVAPGSLDAWRRDYDFVLLLDVIEHLNSPEQFLDRLRKAAGSLDGRPRLIVTSGNIAFFIVRFQSLLGNFNYSRRGILNLANTRLYTFRSLRALFEQCGFRIERMHGIPVPFPVALGVSRLATLLVRLNSILIRLSRGLFSYQIFLVASPLPTVEALLNKSVAESVKRAAILRDPADETVGVSAPSRKL
ncbi:MAG: glycosyltransferase/methyltransferase [Blastocatellia bacterium]|nr:MAG: glycosyltransferase/methyltransferase [Blastocatellia bacterium]